MPERMQIPFDLARSYRYADPRHALRVRWMRWMVEDMITVLLEYLRQEDNLPPLSPHVVACQKTNDRRREEERQHYERLEQEAREDPEPDYEPDDIPL